MKEKRKISFKHLWNIVMFVIYIGIGYLVLFTPLLLPYNYRDNNPEEDEFAVPRIILGIGIFAYGFFRGYNIWKSFK